jgi:hypothetical protein
MPAIPPDLIASLRAFRRIGSGPLDCSAISRQMFQKILGLIAELWPKPILHRHDRSGFRLQATVLPRSPEDCYNVAKIECSSGEIRGGNDARTMTVV